jgi:NADPH-dependent 2,4-dienoyl-CoA reductase/sulfur reductase-like enzyme
MHRSSADVLVIGAGPAGIAAATRAAESRSSVVLLDEGLGPGGQIWRPGIHATPPPLARSWVARLERSGASVRNSTSVVDVRRAVEGFIAVAESGDRGVTIEARRLVIATGARERFLPFPGWTRPNVVGVGGAQALLKNGMSVRGKRVVVAGSGPLLLPVSASLSRAGARVAVVAEQAPFDSVVRFLLGLWRSPSRIAQAAAYRAAFLRAPYVTGSWVVAAHGRASVGDHRVNAVELTNGRTNRTIPCDLLCAAFGLVPNTELARLMGCRVENGSVVVDAIQATTTTGVYCAGEPTGVGGVELALVEGEIAGAAASGAAPDAALVARRRRLRRDAADLHRAFALRSELFSLADDATIVCRCEDVPLGALDRRWTARQAKLYTRLGMGPCQGRICGAALECLMGPAWSVDSVRPPIQPACLDTFLATSENS